MPLLKNGKIIDNEWQSIDEAENTEWLAEIISNHSNKFILPFTSISAAQLLNESKFLEVMQVKDRSWGLAIKPSDNISGIISFIRNAIANKSSPPALISIDFPSFSDGRGFSQAMRIKSAFADTITIRATGKMIADQYRQLINCGIDEVLIDEEIFKRQPIEQWLQAISFIKGGYQKNIV